MSGKNDLTDVPINKKVQSLYAIADYWYVKHAIQAIIFNKLFLDGYVCCTEGLYPSNKETLKKALSTAKSPFSPIIERNAANFEELEMKCKRINASSKTKLSIFECQSIVYAILEAGRELGCSLCVLMLLFHYFGKTRFKQNGDFLVAEEVNLIKIDTLQRFVGELDKVPENTNALFRGHSNINYSIQPSLFRLPRYYKNEYMMYQELVIRCPDAFMNCSSHLDFLVEMQHYGLPTRLLDFSFNPLVALYFSCENETNTGEVIIYTVKNSEIVYGKDENAVIRSCFPMLSYKQQKELYLASNGTKNELASCQGRLVDEIRMERPSFSRDITWQDIRTPIFVKPPRSNRRIAHQDGAFLLWGIDTAHYDDKVDDSYVGDQEKYRFFQNEKKSIYYIPQKHKKGILNALNRLGINKAYVYPEIDDVADYLKNTIED